MTFGSLNDRSRILVADSIVTEQILTFVTALFNSVSIRQQGFHYLAFGFLKCHQLIVCEIAHGINDASRANWAR